ncbi:hypothetical protein [Actinoplanes sp. RD1]|uniref:hypothetical protein n=1 Tax=Actinoplanes sp. RD1 TaxID=3064538 RepID=UPI0027421D3B|nr:hypothetical protein [Actinoplanes sp. RD1]
MDPADRGLNAEELAVAVWAATEPMSGRFHPTEKRSDLAALSNRFIELRRHGQGYLEIGLPDREYPLLTMGFRENHAVIHLFTNADQVLLLEGDGTAPSTAEVEVPVIDDAAVFTGDFVLDVDQAWDRVRSFVRTASPSCLGQWCEL